MISTPSLRDVALHSMVIAAPLGVLLGLIARSVAAQTPDIVMLPQLHVTNLDWSATAAYGDLDGDGVPDLALTIPQVFPFDPNLGWGVHRGRGNGTFVQIGQVHVPSSNLLPLLDVDGDGVMDVVSESAQADSITLHASLGVGDGTFLPSVTSVLTIAGTDMEYLEPSHVADMDGDGLTDVIGASNSFTSFLWVARAHHDGTFNLQSVVPAHFSDHPLALADYNVDGFVDVATLGLPTYTITTYLGGPGGMLSSAPYASPQSPATGLFFTYIAAGDFDADGVPDLGLVATANEPDAGYAFMHRGAGNGQFFETDSQAVSGAGPCSAADVNDDGRADLVIGHLTPLLSAGDPAVLSVLLAAETPGFEPDHPVVVDSDNADFQAPTLIDVDGDGNLDIALTRSVFFGRGDGTFIDRTRVLLDKPPINIEAADLDGDGHLDLLGTSNNQHVTIDLAFGDGAGSFPTVTTLDLGGAAQGVAVSDVNGDGHPDLALASGAAGAATGPLSVRLNSGSGLAWGDAIPLDAMDIGPPLLADLNGDGNLDVVDAKPQAKTLSVHAGDGQGAFFAPVTSPAGVSASVFVLADLDSDGALDAILADSANETVLTMHGSGAGSFDAAVTIPVGMLASDIDIGDIDADGLLDCAVASMDTDTLLILAGQATGTFGTLSSIPISGPSSAVKLHDLDRDGRIDVILAQQQLDAVGVLRGLGSGALGPEQIHGVGNKPVDLLLADFDEDGFQDVGVPVKSPGAFNVLWNTTTFFPSLGFQLGSGALMPHLKGSGLPAPDDVVSFEVSGIPGPTPGFLILGLSFSPFAFKGGTLVPSPDVAVPMRAGTPLAGRWPKLPPGTAVYAQAWFAASSDVTASNAVVGVTQ